MLLYVASEYVTVENKYSLVESGDLTQTGTTTAVF